MKTLNSFNLRSLLVMWLYLLITTAPFELKGDQLSNGERIKTVTGRILDNEQKVVIGLTPKSIYACTRREYNPSINNNAYSASLKLFPGQNVIDVITATGKIKSLINFLVDKPHLRFELISTPEDPYCLFSANSYQDGSSEYWEYTQNSFRYVVNVPHASGNLYYNWIYRSGLPAYNYMSPVTAKIFLNERLIYNNTRILYTVPQETEFFQWVIPSVVIHSGATAGGYLVDQNGYRDITEQGALVGVDPFFLPYVVTDFKANGKTDPIVLPIGRSAQFTAKGVICPGTLNEETDRDIAVWYSALETLEGSNVALLDWLGVLTAMSPGHVRVICPEYEGDPIDVYCLGSNIKSVNKWVARTVWPEAPSSLSENSLHVVTNTVSPSQFAAQVDLTISDVYPTDPITDEGTLTRSLYDYSIWNYETYLEEKTEKSPARKTVTINALFENKEFSYLDIPVETVFRFLYISGYANDKESAWKYAKWKYDVNTGNLVSIEYDESVDKDAITTCNILGEHSCRLGPQAYDSENYCASTLGHENVHGGQPYSYFQSWFYIDHWIFPGDKDYYKLVESPAYQWELDNHESIGLSSVELSIVTNNIQRINNGLTPTE